MPVGRPSDRDPEAWFCLAVQLDQNRAADEAFHGRVPLPSLPAPSDEDPAPSDEASAPQETDPLFDARHMNADELKKVLETRLVAQRAVKLEQPAEGEFRLPQKVARAVPPTIRTILQARRSNRFSALELQVPETPSECEEETPEPMETQPP